MYVLHDLREVSKYYDKCFLKCTKKGEHTERMSDFEAK